MEHHDGRTSSASDDEAAATIAALRTLDSSMARLAAALERAEEREAERETTERNIRSMRESGAPRASSPGRRSFLLRTSSRERLRSASSDLGNGGDGGDGDSDSEDDRELERSTIRLDGLEVYAVVSALTTATSIACFDAYSPREWDDLWRSGEYWALLGDTAFMVSSVAGIVAGMHTTLVFSLMTMYGRTALGMDRDDAFGSFFAKTGPQRVRGFKTFLYSLYAFLVQVVVLVTAKTPSRVSAVAFLWVFAWIVGVYRDTEAIIAAAGAIFLPPKDLRPAKEGGGGGKSRPTVRRNSRRESLRAGMMPASMSYSAIQKRFTHLEEKRVIEEGGKED